MSFMINKIISNKYFLLTIRIFLAFVFLFAAISKVTDAVAFSQSINNYKLLPNFLVNFTAIVLPWIEFSAGLLLIFGISVKENSAIFTGLLAIFILAITISLVRGLDIECGCFGTVEGSKIGIIKLLENFGLLAAGLILIRFDSKYLSLAEN